MSPPAVNQHEVPHNKQNEMVPEVAGDQLVSAFQMFNEMSENLSSSYQALQSRVEWLTGELNRVAEQRRCELEEKEKLTQRLTSLLQLLPAGVVVLDKHGNVSESNLAAKEMLGEPLDFQPWRDVIQRCFAPKGDDGHEISLRNGRRISLVTRSLGEHDGQLLLLTDLTETRALQQRLNRHQRLSEMGRMLSSLAHQIRTPLSAAMLYTGHLCDQELSPEQVQRFANKAMSRLSNLEDQIRDMLIFVRSDVKLTENLSVAELMTEIKQTIEVDLSNSHIDCSWQNECPQARLQCNKSAMVGACTNLIKNALQAMAGAVAPRLHITARLFTEQGQEWITICVKDNGPGIEDTVMSALEEPFYTTKPQGTGLGLAVVRAVVAAHQGNFLLRSKVGKGTQAMIKLPVIATKQG